MKAYQNGSSDDGRPFREVTIHADLDVHVPV